MAHFRVWGCPTEVRIYNPLKKKLDPKSTLSYFIRHPDRSKGYKFYCPSRGTRIVESITAKFLENDIGDNGNTTLKEIFVEPNQVVVPIPVIQEKVVSQPIAIINEEPGHQEDFSVPPSTMTELVSKPLKEPSWLPQTL